MQTQATPDKTAMIGFQAPRPLLDALDAEARREGLSRSDVIRRALLRHVRTADETQTATPPRAA